MSGIVLPPITSGRAKHLTNKARTRILHREAFQGLQNDRKIIARAKACFSQENPSQIKQWEYGIRSDLIEERKMIKENVNYMYPVKDSLDEQM